MMLVDRIQKDLFDFVDHDPDDRDGLIHFWYNTNGPALATALKAEAGLKIILNVSNFNSFERLSKKLFLVADKLVLRDTRKYTDEERIGGSYPFPAEEYIPGYINDIGKKLNGLEVPPLGVTDDSGGVWTSTTKKMNNGLLMAYAIASPSLIPKAFTEWILGHGRSFMQTGSIVYAPFIPPIEWEIELLKNDISLPSYFGATPCFHQNYDWLDQCDLDALLSLNFPYLENIDIDTLARIKADNYDEFSNFSCSLLNSIDRIKSVAGTSEFAKEVRYIQRNDIDDNLNRIDQKVKKISQLSSLRKAGILTGLVGLNASMCAGLHTPGLISGLTASAIAMIVEKVAELKSRNDVKSNSGYFLWQIRENSR